MLFSEDHSLLLNDVREALAATCKRSHQVVQQAVDEPLGIEELLAAQSLLIFDLLTKRQNHC